MVYHRKTLAGDVVFEGLGLHTGAAVSVMARPGEHGIRFWTPSGMIKAHPSEVRDTTRCTRLGDLSTVEHLMSALAGLEITDADIDVSAYELPALDGSSATYCQRLAAGGFQMLEEVQAPDLFSRVFCVDQGAKIAIGKGSGHWKYLFESGERWPHQQEVDYPDVIADYVTGIAPCRTWGFEEEVPQLVAAGLARGLDMSKALVLGSEGYVNPPLFEDEPTRHKLLDLIGDLYLAGIPIRYLNVAAERSGHRLNVQAAAKLAEFVS